ncbi:MAG: efflux RND transporter periplasmic adaptor subunit [Desulfobacteraceae bacterium]|nr:efflux RND transporter periplasmic adaptor subunit [Desulfobacteraceae bacterium]
MKKTLVFLIVFALAMLLGWQVFEKATAEKSGFNRRRGPVALAVEIQPVNIITIHNIGEFTGTLVPLSEYVVAPKISGRVEKIPVNIGDLVQGGQLVAVLDDEEFQQQVIQAEAELEVSRANLMERQNARDNAAREYDRTVALRQKKIVSESQLDAVQSELNAQEAKLRVAYAQVSQKEAALKTANIRLNYAQIGLPEKNASEIMVVGERFVDEGELLTVNKPIVSILSIGKLIAVINVIERDYPKVIVGLPAKISTDAYPGKIFSGNVIRIAPMIKEKSREARVEIEISNAAQLLKPGMFVRVKIEFEQRENTTVVPVSALVKRDGERGVFMADFDSNSAKFIPVTVGIESGGMAEVITPRLSGNVVTLGHHLLEDGAPIILPGAAPAEGGRPSGKPAGPEQGKKRPNGGKS